MKLLGVTLQAPSVKVIPIVRETGDIFLQAQAISSFDEFDKICPVPEPPIIQKPGETPTPNFLDAGYRKALMARNKKMMDYMIVHSLLATPGLEWELVKLEDINTYHLYPEDLRAAGFCATEVTRIVNTVYAANSLNDDEIEKARASFLAGKAQKKEQST